MGRYFFSGILAILLAGTNWNLLIQPKSTPAIAAETRWVDSVFQTLNEDERLGQLFMIRAHSNLGPDHIAAVEDQIRRYNVGGLCFFQGTPERQAQLTNQYQQIAKVPMMVSIDAEWGLGMRMRETTISYPQQLMLGAIQDNRLIYDMGKEIARQLNRIGIQINFAPVVDVNNNPKNPVINTRSFGEDRLNVAVKSYMYMQGMQDNGVMACAKHFPGHGDTDVDSHYDLPVIPHSMRRLDSVELYPFRVLSQHGVGSMMVAHLHVPILDATLDLPTTLSRKVITALLKHSIKFNGLIFTDALEMKGVTKNFPCGEIEIRALEAGNDMLLLPEDIVMAIEEIKAAVKNGRLSQADLDARVKKVLRAKYRLGLTKPQVIPLEGIHEDLNSPQAIALKRKLVTNALTLLRNKKNLIPFQELDKTSYASLSMGADTLTFFQRTLSLYTGMEHLQSGKAVNAEERKALISKLKTKDVVIVGLHRMSKYAKDHFGLTESQIDFLKDLRKETKVVLVVFGNPYSLESFEGYDWLLEAYDDDPITQELAAQGLFGAFGFRGRLPVSASESYAFNSGITTTGIFRLSYGLPEEVGMNSKSLARLDDIAREAIQIGAAPGCVALVAKDGKVVYRKAFGKHTYDGNQLVKVSDIYDLASITKIAATTLSVMKLQEEGHLDVHDKLSRYLTDLDGTNKANLCIDEVLAHRAGLISWIPFYEKTIQKNKKQTQPSPKFYSNRATLNFAVPVANNLFLRNDYKSVIWNEILQSKLRDKKAYHYSDLGFYMVGELVNRISGSGMDAFVEQKFYRSLGMQTTTFNPWQRHAKTAIVPTEEDSYFRYQTVHSYVHDMGAAMLGGVSGHAGLFSDANDLAILMQMLLNKGFYGGERYLKTETVRQFTSRCEDCTRRGLGFDMKDMARAGQANLPDAVSDNTFGHLGFTGTCAWADPDNHLIFIFLSNRTYPSQRNNKLNEADIRNRMFAAVYEAMGK